MVAYSWFSPLLFLLPLHTWASDDGNNVCKKVRDYSHWSLNGKCDYDPNMYISVPSMIINCRCCELEVHKVESDNGYVLTLFRLAPKNRNTTIQRATVFIQHGLMASAGVFTSSGKNDSLAFRLVEEGYDVWLGNARGTTYSREHVRITVYDNEYWDYTLDDMGLSDLSHMITHVSDKTGRPGSIVYIGHSMATTMAMMYASTKVEEAHNHLRGLILMSPVAYLSDARGFILYKYLVMFFKDLGFRAIFRDEVIFQRLTQSLCNFLPTICTLMMDFVLGESKQLTPDNKMLLLSQCPTAASIYQLEHFIQIYERGELARFDYGKLKNSEVYGREYPPRYNLNRIKLPTFLFCGKNDALATQKGATRILDELGSSLKQIVHIPRKGYGYCHANFMYALSYSTDLIPEILAVLDDHFK